MRRKFGTSIGALRVSIGIHNLSLGLLSVLCVYSLFSLFYLSPSESS